MGWDGNDCCDPERCGERREGEKKVKRRRKRGGVRREEKGREGKRGGVKRDGEMKVGVRGGEGK